jgi:hypothetical protein
MIILNTLNVHLMISQTVAAIIEFIKKVTVEEKTMQDSLIQLYLKMLSLQIHVVSSQTSTTKDLHTD